MIPTYTENDKFYFDSAAADRPIRFIERYCMHTEGRHAGKKFILLPWQKTLVRTIFGWKRREDNLRRFRELLLLTAKGAGKTPLLAALGTYLLIEEAAAHVISIASEAKQARLTFDASAGYVNNSPELAKFLQPRQNDIIGVRKKKYEGAKWTTVSGKPKGASGSRPSAIIADECHEWAPVTCAAFDILTANCFKRAQPLILMATNAGDSRGSYAFQKYERALAVREGSVEDEALLPVIFEAPEDLDWGSEEAARASNPSMPEIVKFSQIQPEISKGEARYRRLYLSQWPKSIAASGLDMNLWDKCSQTFEPKVLSNALLYVGVDLSLNNDLCAVTYVWATPDRYYVDADFWIPRPRAEEHQQKFNIRYLDWAEHDKAITLVDGPTITPAVRLQIAARIMERAAGFKLKAVCYDSHRAAETVAALESQGVTCVCIKPWALTPGCEELQRRLQEDNSLVIAPNPVMRMCAVNARFSVPNAQGNYWVIKPNANAGTNYAGLRHAKIDGAVALTHALTEARKALFPNARKMFNNGAKGGISIVKPLVARPTPQPAPPSPHLAWPFERKIT